MFRRFTLILISMLLAGLAQATRNECFNLLPSNVTKASEVRICSSSFNGITNYYSCQEYSAEDEHYRVLYKGGVTPTAILKFDKFNRRELVWSHLYGDQEINCPLAPPEGIPAQAAHQGIGVCLDDNDKYVPCSVFEHAGYRQAEAFRYFAFYDPNGAENVTITTFVMGDNPDAITAELAYQIGVSLNQTDCCRTQALEYLEYAYRLFPSAYTYRVTYHRAKASLAAVH